MPDRGARVPPVVEDLLAARSAEEASFHMPGHKGLGGAPALGVEVLGAAAYLADLSELSGFDYLHAAGAGVAAAQARASHLFGADRTWFLVNGATVGNLAALWSVAGDSQRVVLPRSSHRSVYAALSVSGASPAYVAPVRNRALDGIFGVTEERLAKVLSECPGARALHVTSPNYYGFTAPVRALAELAHSRGIPLIVDEAHGSHFAFSDRFPPGALASGADLVIQSPHKTLGSLTQSSLLHHRGGLVDPFRIDSLLQMLQSSSPSALLLVSLDVALEEMAERGRRRWEAAIALADEARRQVTGVEGLRAYGSEVVGTPGISGLDPTKVVVDVSGLGTTAFSAARWLRANHGINPEFADLRRLVFSITVADTEETVELLGAALADLAGRAGELAGPVGSVTSLWPEETPELVLSPRRASEAECEVVELERSAGRVSGEMIVPYPPGIPLVVPGERMTSAVIDTMRQLGAAGCRLVGPADATLATLRCIRT